MDSFPSFHMRLSISKAFAALFFAILFLRIDLCRVASAILFCGLTFVVLLLQSCSAV
jgi:hypothetical protein